MRSDDFRNKRLDTFVKMYEQRKFFTIEMCSIPVYQNNYLDYTVLLNSVESPDYNVADITPSSFLMVNDDQSIFKVVLSYARYSAKIKIALNSRTFVYAKGILFAEKNDRGDRLIEILRIHNKSVHICTCIENYFSQSDISLFLNSLLRHQMSIIWHEEPECSNLFIGDDRRWKMKAIRNLNKILEISDRFM